MSFLDLFRRKPPDIVRWASSFDVLGKDWLILGKGPSFRELDRFDLSRFHTCSLNHVVRELPVDLAHIIDLDVVEDCREALERNARFLVLPYFPHVRHRPTRASLLDFIPRIPVLGSLRRQGRLIWYNLSTCKRRIGGSPVITARFFSAEAAVNLLAALGVRTIRSLGVDGGKSYAPQYQDLAGKTLLANRHSSFDRQFEQIARTIRTRGIFYAPLHKEAPLRVFALEDGSPPLAARVLEFSIKKHSSMSVSFRRLSPPLLPPALEGKLTPPLSRALARLAVPALCGSQGRAICLDAGMLILDDLSRLWDLPLEGADVLCVEGVDRGRRQNPIVLDASKLAGKLEEALRGLEEGRPGLREALEESPLAEAAGMRPSIPSAWASTRLDPAGKAAALQFRDPSGQPWRSRSTAEGSLWLRYLREAVEEGFIGREEVLRAVEADGVDPGLPRDLGLAPPFVAFPRPESYSAGSGDGSPHHG